MEFKVSLKYVPLPCDENIKHITCYHRKLNSKIEGGNLKLEGVTWNLFQITPGGNLNRGWSETVTPGLIIEAGKE